MTSGPPRDILGRVDERLDVVAPGAHTVPSSVRAMLASEAREPFDSDEHIFELMWAGVRVIAYVSDGHVRLCGRNGRDLAPYFPELQIIPERLRAREAVLDGEIIALDAEGHPAFDMLRGRLRAVAADALGRGGAEAAIPSDYAKLPRIGGQLTFQASDVLWLDGRDLTERPLWQRKNRLHDAIAASPEFAAVDFVDDEGIAFFDAVLERKLEGVVAKQKMSTYTPGRRSKSWLEIRALHSGDFVIGGYTFGGAARKDEAFGQLLLGAYDEGRFEYVGGVSGGLSDAEASDLVALIEPLLADVTPFIDPPRIPRFVCWTRPSLVCRARFSEWSGDGYLRFPIFSALRGDLEARECILE